MTASTGPLSSAPLPGISQAYISAQATVQIRKKVPIGPPEDAPRFLASSATMLPQYAKPINTVSTDPQRNHHNARDIRLGRTLPLVAGSSSFMKGTLTRLKKYSRPTQVMPPTKCNQRNSIRRVVLKSVGRLMLVKAKAPILKRRSGTDDCRWLAREMKPGRLFWSGRTWRHGKSRWARHAQGRLRRILLGGKLKSA